MEDDSLLDDPTILARETPPQANVTPGSFSIKLVSRLGLNQIQRSETVYNNNKTTLEGWLALIFQRLFYSPVHFFGQSSRHK